ncbi:hypothetical protein [Candidatus Fukatsuia endosymbiont of Tuberolachnus salignus]|uniref:hypothetical protein n=1 Tax=Candidatus Fukatsuia endosymbiont of Tuberolachnus salignus TaxID=3077957 RepID=UPI00313D65A7
MFSHVHGALALYPSPPLLTTGEADKPEVSEKYQKSCNKFINEAEDPEQRRIREMVVGDLIVCKQRGGELHVRLEGLGLTGVPPIPLETVSLDLSNNPLSLSPKALADLATLHNLTKLDISNTGLTDQFLSSLTTMLMHKNIQELNISHNKELGQKDDAVQHFSMIIGHCSRNPTLPLTPMVTVRTKGTPLSEKLIKKYGDSEKIHDQFFPNGVDVITGEIDHSTLTGRIKRYFHQQLIRVERGRNPYDRWEPVIKTATNPFWTNLES